MLLLYAPWLALLGGGMAPPTARQMILLARTLAYAGAVGLLALLLGLLIATELGRWSRRAQGAAVGLGWLLLALPGPVYALAWMVFVGRFGDRGSGWLRLPLEGWAPAAAVHAAALLPVAVVAGWLALRQAGPVVDAARQMAAPGRVLREVVLPLAAPGLIAGGAAVMLLAAVDYAVPSLFAADTFPMEILSRFSAGGEVAGATGLGFVMVLVLAPLAWPVARWLMSFEPAAEPGPGRWPAWPVLVRSLGTLAVAFAAAQVLVPSLVLADLARSGAGVPGVERAATAGLAFSVTVAAGAAVVAAVLGLLVVVGLPLRRGAAWWALVLLPLALPPPLLGIALARLPWPTGAVAPVMLAAGWLQAPLVAVLVGLARRTMPGEVRDAGDLFGTGPADRWWRLDLPWLAPALLAGAALAYARALGEVAATLIVVPPGRETLALRVYNLLHYGASGEAAGAALVLIVAVLPLAVVAAMASRWRTRTEC